MTQQAIQQVSQGALGSTKSATLRRNTACGKEAETEANFKNRTPQTLASSMLRRSIEVPKISSAPVATNLQTKLTVNLPGDKYEQEADRTADQILRMVLSSEDHSDRPTQDNPPTAQSHSMLQRHASTLMRKKTMSRADRATEKAKNEATIDENMNLVIDQLHKAGITDDEGVADVLAQIEDESRFIPHTESLKYKPEALAKAFPTHVKDEADATKLKAQGEEAIGNRIYGGRMGNAQDEGFKYRGRGFIQITGKDNYEEIGKQIGEDLTKQPDKANDPEVAAKIVPQFFLGLKHLKPKDLSNIDKVNKAVGFNDDKKHTKARKRKERAKYYLNLLKQRKKNAPKPSAIPLASDSSVVQRQSRSTVEPDAPEIVNEVLASTGKPLDTAVRAFMEPRFGCDFSHVRVHTDERAVASAEAVQARAYTVGNNIVFGRNEHPSRDALLLAHELTHVRQQSSAMERPPAKNQVSVSQGLLDDGKCGVDGPTKVKVQMGRSFSVQRTSDEYSGIPGWIHSAFYDRLLEDYQSWIVYGMRLTRQGDAVFPGLGTLAGVIPIVAGTTGGSLIGIAKFLTPRNEDEAALGLLTADLGPAVCQALDIVGPRISYGLFRFGKTLKASPRLLRLWTGLRETMPNQSAEVLQRVEQRAPETIAFPVKQVGPHTVTETVIDSPKPQIPAIEGAKKVPPGPSSQGSALVETVETNQSTSSLVTSHDTGPVISSEFDKSEMTSLKSDGKKGLQPDSTVARNATRNWDVAEKSNQSIGKIKTGREFANDSRSQKLGSVKQLVRAVKQAERRHLGRIAPENMPKSSPRSARFGHDIQEPVFDVVKQAFPDLKLNGEGLAPGRNGPDIKVQGSNEFDFIEVKPFSESGITKFIRYQLGASEKWSGRFRLVVYDKSTGDVWMLIYDLSTE